MKPKKDEFLQIRLSAEQKESIRNAAKEADTDMSSWILSKVANSRSVDFSKIVNKLNSEQQQTYVYAEINDLLAKCNSTSFSTTVMANPTDGLDAFQANYVAAMVEHCAQKMGELAPAWCNSVSQLQFPHFGSDLKSLKLHLLLNSPLAFRRRNIFIDSSVGERV